MNSSVSKPSGILFDTNVLSLFARIDRLELLFSTFVDAHNAHQLYVSPSIKRELEMGFHNGTAYISNCLARIDAGDLQVLQPTDADRRFGRNLPPKLGAGEVEAIALCQRLNLVFVSHDRKATNYCERVGIQSIKLIALIERLRRAHRLTDSEIETMFQ
ncbi:MAG: hypothetical protein KDE19_07445 [Caldilineaceae bacterium]|nr:hypothetical protein [Caldilineaceae bacterium]